jgi:hypothetical protein
VWEIQIQRDLKEERLFRIDGINEKHLSPLSFKLTQELKQTSVKGIKILV